MLLLIPRTNAGRFLEEESERIERAHRGLDMQYTATSTHTNAVARFLRLLNAPLS